MKEKEEGKCLEEVRRDLVEERGKKDYLLSIRVIEIKGVLWCHVCIWSLRSLYYFHDSIL